MLVLTRNKNEALMIGDDVVVRVLGVKGGQVKIGVEAPADKPVDREEIYRAKQAERSQQPPEKTSPLKP